MPKINNFDLIRLVAALQVAITHVIVYLVPASRGSLWLGIVELFPGVPIFFFISGFLISKSFEKNSNVKEFVLNRFLRIYPGLAVCFIASVGAVWLAGYFATVSVSFPEILVWVLAQLTVFQFYNPAGLRHFGTGVLDGSMWSITVEVQFYILVPILYMLLRGARSSRQRTNAILLVLVLLFWGINKAYVVEATSYANALWFKLMGVSFLPWFYMFLVGVVFQRNFDVLSRWFAGRFVLAFGAYCVVAIAGNAFLRWNVGNTLNFVVFLALAVAIFSAAFSRNSLSDKMLRRNDLSYGVYIYHMPIANTLLAMGLGRSSLSFLSTIVLTLVCAYASWQWVEKPALRFKRHPLYQHDPQMSGRAQTVAL